MNESQEGEKFFIDSKPVNWDDIGDPERQNLDFVPDILTDTELTIFRVLVYLGPHSTRNIWNRVCEHIFGEELEIEETSRSYDEIRDIMSDRDIKFPSYHTVKKSLHTMNENGMITTRPSNKGNTDELYTINPKFKKVWRKRRNQIIENKKLDQLNPRAIKFYNIQATEDDAGNPVFY